MRIPNLMVLCALAALGCGKKEDPQQAAPAATLSASKADPGAMTAKYTVDGKGTTSIDMPAPKEHIKADTTAMAGSLEVDLVNLANSRGELKADLTTLSTHTFGSEDDNATQTKHARTWLEVVVDGKTNEDQRWAVFAIRSIDGLSEPNVSKVAPTKDGSDDVRKVSMTVHGDFLVHGHKVAKDATVDVEFRYPSGAAADSKPTVIHVKTKTPMHIVLADHDIKPRDNLGVIAQRSFHLLGTKVADTADVTIDLKAAPAS
jgi:hypothetical protein